jgi:hypothetical protein
MKEIDWSNHDHRKFIIDKIKLCEHRSKAQNDSPGCWATHRRIWAGSYDVISCEQDRIDGVEIPKAQMKIAWEAGLIRSEMKIAEGKTGSHKMEVWSVTELGEEFLKGDNYVRRN